MVKIVSTSRTFGKYSHEPIKLLKDAGHSVKLELGMNTEEQMIEAVKGMEAIIVGVEPITKRVIESSPELKVIAKHGMGVDNIDLEAARSANITVINAPGANRHAVADYVIGLMITIRRGIPKSYVDLQNKKWNIHVGNELYTKTLGVIGTGRIGTEVIRRAAGFQMKILALDVYENEKLKEEFDLSYVTKEELLRESDFLTLHIDLTEKTKNFIDNQDLQMMKKDATLINTSRGGVINENALYEFMKQNESFAAGLDVFENEPFDSHPLLSLDNFIGTPHNAGYTMEALNEIGVITAKNLIDIFIGKAPLYEVI